jgi:hypothetical protein
VSAAAVTIVPGAPDAGPASGGCAVSADAFVLPARIAEGRSGSGPRFADDVWDVTAFVPWTTGSSRIDFTTIADSCQRQTAREFLYSRINRAVPVGGMTARPMKITNLTREFSEVRAILADFAAAGAPRLADVTPALLTGVLAGWRTSTAAAAGKAGVVRHMAAHGPFLTDKLTFMPWLGRTANQVAGRMPLGENTTPRIPEDVIAPLLKAAVFYVCTASGDLLAAKAELTALHAAIAGMPRLSPGQTRARLEAFVETRHRDGRGIPARPGSGPAARQPNLRLICLLAGIPSNASYHREYLDDAARRTGFEHGGLTTPLSEGPLAGRAWRPGLETGSLDQELHHLRTACWIVIAYLSGMRDPEVRELAPGCAVTEPGSDGRVRRKLRGRVFKGRKLTGDEADWVVLGIVHDAVAVLLQVNDHPTHLFGWDRGGKKELMRGVPGRVNRFAAHCNQLWSAPGRPFIPDAGGGPWSFDARQFRRSLAWHIAHQPFGVVAGARQYQHAKVAVFEGYAGTSQSGFAAEVEAEQNIARLDYLEDLYRRWNTGEPAGGGAARHIDAEFTRIRADLADLPGTIASPARLRTMLQHLSVILHPGVLGDCFFQPATAACLTRARPAGTGRPLPMLNSCLSCPNARRTPEHQPRLELARDQARQALEAAGKQALPPLQRAALDDHLSQLDQLICQCTSGKDGNPR